MGIASWVEFGRMSSANAAGRSMDSKFQSARTPFRQGPGTVVPPRIIGAANLCHPPAHMASNNDCSAAGEKSPGDNLHAKVVQSYLFPQRRDLAEVPRRTACINPPGDLAQTCPDELTYV
eukprot:4698515-Pyramimonas_sp.AAC.2